MMLRENVVGKSRDESRNLTLTLLDNDEREDSLSGSTYHSGAMGEARVRPTT